MSNIGQKTYDNCTPHRVAFLGLGVMGLPMAGHLALAVAAWIAVMLRQPQSRPRPNRRSRVFCQTSRAIAREVFLLLTTLRVLEHI